MPGLSYNTPKGRFAQNYTKTEDGCWLWKGAPMNTTGYGKLTINKKAVAAHRFSYEQSKGPIPAGMCVLHSCDVRLCVNPDHLFLGTRQDNNKDMDNKGRRKTFGQPSLIELRETYLTK